MAVFKCSQSAYKWELGRSPGLVSRRKKGSANREKAVRQLARAHLRVANVRRDALHQITSRLTKTKSVVVLEDLHVSGMVKNHHLAQAIADVGFYEFRRQMVYKGQWYGCQVLLANRFHPSSKSCSQCGNIQATLDLGTRVYICGHCGLMIDRDLNAALNLEQLTTGSSPERYTYGECVSPGYQAALVEAGTEQQSTNVCLCRFRRTVLADRQKDSVVEFLRGIPERVSQTIHTVCCDMWEGYTEAVREKLQSVRIVIDRFHVAKSNHAAADSMRKQELKRSRSELTEEEYQQLKGSMWAFRKKPGELKPEECQALKCLFAHAPKLKLAYDLREQLTDIFEQTLTKSEVQKKIPTWIKRVKRSELKCINDFLNSYWNYGQI